jgi:hypothetical protein
MMDVEKILAITIPVAVVGSILCMTSCMQNSDRLSEPRRMVEAQRSIECMRAGGTWLVLANDRPACIMGKSTP